MTAKHNRELRAEIEKILYPDNLVNAEYMRNSHRPIVDLLMERIVEAQAESYKKGYIQGGIDNLNASGKSEALFQARIAKIVESLPERKRIDWCPSENCHYNQCLEDCTNIIKGLE